MSARKWMRDSDEGREWRARMSRQERGCLVSIWIGVGMIALLVLAAVGSWWTGNPPLAFVAGAWIAVFAVGIKRDVRNLRITRAVMRVAEALS